MHSVTKPPTAAEHSVTPLLFPFLDLKAEYGLMKAEIQAAVEMVLESQQFIMGPQVRELETEVAALVGCRFAIGCASGSDALLLALMALGVDSGAEVITVPFTFVATAGSVSRLKAKPVFVDIDPETYNLDATHLESVITSRTRAIIPVHLFGLPAEMETITQIARANGVPVIEDAAQSIGARYIDSRCEDKNVGNIIFKTDQREVIDKVSNAGINFGVGGGLVRHNPQGAPDFFVRVLYWWGDDVTYVIPGSLYIDQNGYISYSTAKAKTTMLVITVGFSLNNFR